MITAPETPFVLSALFIIAASVKRAGKVDTSAFRGLLASLFLVIIASATSGTKAAQVVRAFGYLFFIVSASVAVRAFTSK